MLIDLTEKKILVTGASRGIGYAIAEQLLSSGATVALHYFTNGSSLESLQTQYTNKAFALKANLESEAETVQLVAQAYQQMNGLNVVVNNAGIAILSDPEKDWASWAADWNKTMQVNLTATALICHECLPIFEAQKEGIMVNISSRAAFRGDTKEYMAYAASKGGMVALTRSIARGYGKANIKAFTIAPGFTRTDMAEDFITEYGEDYVLNDISLPQLTLPKDLAPMIALLCSGMANHATGATIDMNAGSYVH